MRSVIAAVIWIIARTVVSTLVWGRTYNPGVKWLVTEVVKDVAHPALMRPQSSGQTDEGRGNEKDHRFNEESKGETGEETQDKKISKDS